MSTSSKINLSFNPETFPELLTKLSDLGKIDQMVRFKVNKDKLFIYTTLTNKNAIIAFKNYLLKTTDYITFKPGDLEDNSIDFIIGDIKTFVKQCKLFSMKNKIMSYITVTPDTKEEDIFTGKNVWLGDGKLKFSVPCTDISKVRNITPSALSQIISDDKMKWNFSVSGEDFETIRKLAATNTLNRILCVRMKNKQVFISDEYATWEILVAEKDFENKAPVSFNKQYLGLVNKDDFEEVLEASSSTIYNKIDFCIFDTTIVFKTDESNLLISFEMDF